MSTSLGHPGTVDGGRQHHNLQHKDGPKYSGEEFEWDGHKEEEETE